MYDSPAVLVKIQALLHDFIRDQNHRIKRGVECFA